ncbi:MAG UNVERIFIED_CONTAM: hypothetical protein LVR29_21755 [Microcystis novacekii LVE1205-3]
MLNEFHATHPNIRVFYTQTLKTSNKNARRPGSWNRRRCLCRVLQFLSGLGAKGYTLDLRKYVAIWTRKHSLTGRRRNITPSPPMASSMVCQNIMGRWRFC